MKKALVVILALMISLMLAGCGIADLFGAETTKKQETITIVIGHFGAPNEPVTKAAEAFKAKVEELSGGTMIVDIHGASELGNAKEMVEQTAINAIQACLVSQGSLDKYDIRYALVTAPYLYSGYDHAYAVVDGPFADWVNDGTLEAKGLHNVGPWDYGFRCLTNSVREVKVPDDVKGLKIRTPSEVQKVACFEALGADVQQVAFSELISALKQGTVDGQENPLSTIYNNSMWDAEQKYLSLTRHTWEAVNLTFSNTFWNSLSAEQRTIIEQASAAARDQMRSEVQSGEQDYIQKLKDEGVTVTEVDMEAFKEAMAPAWEKVAEYEGSEEDMTKFLKMVEDTAP